MKTFLKILAGFLLLAAIAGGAAFYFTADLPRTAEAFFRAADNQDDAALNELVSAEFLSNTSIPQLYEFLAHNDLVGFQSASWHQRSINNGVGSLSGTVTTKRGEVQLKLSLTKKENSWQIQHVSVPPAGVSSENAPVRPGDQEMIQLVNNSMRSFGESVNAKSMQIFHTQLAPRVRRTNTIEKLDKAFESFYQDGDFLPLVAGTPTISALPELNNGLLSVAGFYISKHYRTGFELVYLHDEGRWQTADISVDVKPLASDPSVTADE